MGVASGSQNDPKLQSAECQEGGSPFGGGTALSLDTYLHSRTGGEWTPQQKRLYHRLNTFLTRVSDCQVLWVTLTSSPASDPSKLSYHHKRLLQVVERKLGFKPVHQFHVITSEGHGVIHAFWAYGGRRQFFIPQGWLSDQWQEIHSARVVWITKCSPGKSSRARLSRYAVTQYAAGQDLLVRFAWSWYRTFGLGVVGLWALWKSFYSGRYRALRLPMWHALLRGEVVLFADGRMVQLPGGVLGCGTYT